MVSTEGDHRLPHTAVPRRYWIHLRPDFDARTFQGEERVEIEVVEDTAELVCHAAELDISSARLRSLDDAAGEVLELTVTSDALRERCHLLLPQSAPAGRYQL